MTNELLEYRIRLVDKNLDIMENNSFDSKKYKKAEDAFQEALNNLPQPLRPQYDNRYLEIGESKLGDVREV